MAHCVPCFCKKIPINLNPSFQYKECKYNYTVGFLNIKKHLTKGNIAFIVLAAVAVIFCIQFRTTMLSTYGFYEPDGYYYFTAMRAIINNGFKFPPLLAISGYPQHAPIAEAHGIYWLTLIPYILLSPFNISYYTIMRLMPVAFALLDMLAAWLLSRYLSRDKLFGAFVLFFVALSMGNAARTSALIYRGDSFVTFFLAIALVLLIETLRQEDARKKAVLAVATSIALLGCNLVWNGASFADATFISAFFVIAAFAFVFRKEKLFESSKYMLLSIIIWYILVNASRAAGFIPGQQLTGPEFIPIFAVMVAFWAILLYLPQVLPDASRKLEYRIGVVVAIILIGIILFAVLEPSAVYSIFVGNGFIAAPGSFASTTQELQPPTCEFLYTSFGINMFTSLPDLAMELSSLSGLQCGTAAGSFYSLWTVAYGALGIILLLITFIPYLFMQVYDSSGFFGGKPKIMFSIEAPMLVIMTYFIITAYLEMHAIRFNSLLSIPLAIVSAYTLYWIILMANGTKLFYPNGRYVALLAMAIIVAYIFYQLYYFAAVYSSTLSPADSINPQFISALMWLKANSPPSSVVLTLWPDGSVVEGVANRTSVMDSVGSENGSKATPFAAWLFNSSPDPSFLTSSIAGSPNYLLVRSPWMIETQGIYTEANIGTNSSVYGYASLISFSEQSLNSTTKAIVMSPTPGQTYPSAVLKLSYSNPNGTLASLFGYLQESQIQTSPFSRVVLSDFTNNNVTVVDQGGINQTNGETLFVQYSQVPRQNLFLNITTAYVFGPAISQSNLVKTLFLCGSNYCAWDNNKASLQIVYANSDTKIFKIIYNSTS